MALHHTIRTPNPASARGRGRPVPEIPFCTVKTGYEFHGTTVAARALGTHPTTLTQVLTGAKWMPNLARRAYARFPALVPPPIAEAYGLAAPAPKADAPAAQPAAPVPPAPQPPKTTPKAPAAFTRT